MARRMKPGDVLMRGTHVRCQRWAWNVDHGYYNMGYSCSKPCADSGCHVPTWVRGNAYAHGKDAPNYPVPAIVLDCHIWPNRVDVVKRRFKALVRAWYKD